MFSAAVGVVVSTNLVVVSETWDATLSCLIGHIVFNINFTNSTVWYSNKFKKYSVHEKKGVVVTLWLNQNQKHKWQRKVDWIY